MSEDLVEHRQENYPSNTYRQPNPVFWHSQAWVQYCSLCRIDGERTREEHDADA